MKHLFFRRGILIGFQVGTLLMVSYLAPLNPVRGQSTGRTPNACPVQAGRDSKSGPVTLYPLVENHKLVTWETLAHFPYDIPDIEEEIDPSLRLKKKKYPIPGYIKKLNGEKVAIVGFMIPVDTNEAGDKATSFILARSQATCCFGITVKMNEWMFVKMEKGKESEAVMDVPGDGFRHPDGRRKEKNGAGLGSLPDGFG